jgi:spore maturation protein CgeB
MRGLMVNPAPAIKYGLVPGLQQSGVECLLMEGDLALDGLSDEEAQELLRQVAGDFKPDFLLSKGHFHFQDPGWLRRVTANEGWDALHVYWATDDPTFHETVSLPLATHSDCVFTTTEELLPAYREAGVRAELCPFGCNPEFHRPVPPKDEYRCDLALVAHNYGERAEAVQWFLLPLLELGYDVKVWGFWWNDPAREVNLNQYPGVHQGVISYKETPAVYASAKIVLGLNFADTSLTQTSMRPYEVLACGGGLYLGHYTKAQERIFGGYLFQARDAAGTKEIVDYLLSRDEGERRSFAEEARRFVCRQHTYEQRAERMLQTIREVMAARA